MPVVQDSDMLHLNCPEFYNVWKGQFYIHKHLVCSIELKSSNSCSVPTQLPNKLEITKVIRLSELRKALPQSVFEKADCTGQEVCCERVYYSLFPVTASNEHGLELVKLLNWLADGDLALIKILNDQGFLILVTPSALQFNKGLNQKDSFRLYALFLFPHTKLLDKREREDSDWTLRNEDLSLNVTNLLPGLQYAILETQQMQKDRDFKPNAGVELHVKQYACLLRKNGNIGAIEATEASGQSAGHKEHIPEKCDQLALSSLQTYFSSPVNFSVPLVKMSTLLKEEVPKSSKAEVDSKNVIVKDSVALDTLLATSTNKSGSSSGKSVLHENRKQPSKKRSFKKSGRRGSRKSRRKHAHQPTSEKSENPVSSKKLKLQDEEAQQAVTPSKLTVKLASAPYPHGRKRGAEVLTAEFVNDDKICLTETVADKRDKQQSTIITDNIITRKLRERSPAKELFLRPERPPKRKASEAGNRNKLPEAKPISEINKRHMTRQKEQAERQLNKAMEAITSLEPVTSFRRLSTGLDGGTKQSPPPAPVPNPENNIMEKRINMYESHALNLLADLALNSFCSSTIPYITSESVAPKSEPLVKEKVHEDDSANAVEYPQNDCNLPVQSSTASQEPSQASDCKNIPVKIVKDPSPLHTSPQQRTENSEKQTSYKVLIAAAKARARSNTTSKISLEHSYSQLPKEDAPETLSKEVTEESIQKGTEPTSPAAVVMEQSPDDLFPGEVLVQRCDNVHPDLSKEPRAVSKLQDKIRITFNWDTKYDFDLDSKFTNDPLEKTINRALHGPWNPHLKEKVEDVKIILHMWLALFYSKPSQPVPSSSRKVVEHSNPAKYVSINTVLDPCFEIVESDDARLNSPDAEKDSDPLIESSVQQEVERSNSNNLPIDLSLSSSKPKKDYNIKLSSEIFQMYNSSSLSALYPDSLQTTVMCKMMPTSKVSTPPTNYMTTGSIPTVCYIGDSKQVNAELTTKTEKGVDIGGSSSGKVGFRESEHKYSKRFFDVETTQKSSRTEKGIHLLNNDATSGLHENKDCSEISDMSASSENSLTQKRISSLNDLNEDHQANAKSESAASQNCSSFTNKDAEVSPSNALNMDSYSADLYHKKYRLSRLSNTAKEHIAKSKSALVSWMQQENVRASSERDETIIQTAKTRIVLKPKIQKKNIDSAVDKRDPADSLMKNTKELETSNFHLVLKDGNRSELVISEGSSHIANDFKSLDLVGSQAQSCSSENFSHLANEKAPESDGGLSDEHFQSVYSERSSRQENSEDQQQEEIKDCTGNELHDIKDTDTLIHLELKNNNMKEAKGHSPTHKEILGKWSEESSEEIEDSAMVKNVVHEIAASESMSKLELSPSSDETSDVDNIDTDGDAGYLQSDEEVDVSRDGIGLLQNMDGNSELDLASSSLEQPVTVLHKDDSDVPEDSCDVDLSSIIVPVTKQNSEMDTAEKKDKDFVDIHIACNSAVDTTDSLSTLSTDPHLKGTNNVNNHFLENDICEAEAPCDNKQAVFNEEAGCLNSAKKPGEHSEMCLGEEPSLTDSPKFADLEETSLFERLNSENMRDHCTVHSSTIVEQHESLLPVHSKDTFPAVKEKSSLVECPVEQTDHSGSPGTDTLAFNIEVVNRLETVVPHLEALQRSKEVTPDIFVRELESSKHSESSPVETHAEPLAAKPHSDYTSNAVNSIQSSNQLEKSSKDRTHRIQNSIRKEFFFKLKRICLSSGAGQHASTNSEDEVYVVHEEPGKCITEEHKKTADFEAVDVSKPELNTESTSKTEEDKTDRVILFEENLVQEIPIIAASLTEVEPETLLELDQMTSQRECLSPAHHDLFDTGQGQVWDKCLSPAHSDLVDTGQGQVWDKYLSSSNSDLIDNMEQDPVKCLSPPISVGSIEQMHNKDKCSAPLNVDLNDNIEQRPVGEGSLVPPNTDLIDNVEQSPIAEKCLAHPNVGFTDDKAQSPVGEESLVPPNADLIDNVEQDPIAEKCLAQSNAGFTDDKVQSPVGEESLVPPYSDLIDHVEQDPIEDKCLASPNVGSTDDLAWSPVGEQNLLPPSSDLIDSVEQSHIKDKCLSPPYVGFTDVLAQSSVEEKSLVPTNGNLYDNLEQEPVQDKCLVLPHVDVIDSMDQDPVQNKYISPPCDNLIDRLEQDPVQDRGLSSPSDDFTSSVKQDHVQNKCPSPFHTEMQDSAQNKCINPPCNSLIENLGVDPIQDKGLPLFPDSLTNNTEQNHVQDKFLPPLNTEFINIIEHNPLHNKCPSPLHTNFTDGLEQNPVQDKCLSPSHDEFTDSMEQEEQSEICCIVSTGSISKEQYDRWSETSDDDIEVIQAYKETLSDKASSDFQEECKVQQLMIKPSHPSKTQLLKRCSGPNISLMAMNEYDSGYHRDYPIPKSHRNVIVSKNNSGRTFHRESPCAGRHNLDGLFNRRMVSDDLTQNTIDTEQLLFMCKLKDTLRKSSTDMHVSEPPFQTMFESNRIPSVSGSGTKCRSPLLITVQCPSRRRDCRSHDRWHPSSSYNQAYYDDGPRDRYYSRTTRKMRAHRYSPPYHFNRLRYKNTLEKPSNDISVILNECAQSNHIKLSRVCLGSATVERTSTCPEPEENRLQARQPFEPLSSKSQTVGNIISDLCTSLHSKLQSVAKKTAKQNLYFYLFKTVDGKDDDDFFSSTKSLLIKDGHTPIEPQDFCVSEQAKSNKLTVIIKNENVSSRIHKIPCLLQLKLHPNVMFAGVDSPEDVTESMYQELFQAGGIVVSDKALLENIIIGKLKEVLMILERMNRTSAWKWFIHYGENRKLKEDRRTESVSQTKMALLKSYQHSNIIEILPYHQCDSKSKEPSSDLECLLSLQSQHICSRLAVYLTAMPCPEAADFEQHGILVNDVDTFIRRIQKVDAQLHSSSWS